MGLISAPSIGESGNTLSNGFDVKIKKAVNKKSIELKIIRTSVI